MTASPSPISITPAFSPGPWITHGALVGSPRKCTLDDLYEQCSFHIAEKIASSVKLGVRPISFRMRSYASGLGPWSATRFGVMAGSLRIMKCCTVRPCLATVRRNGNAYSQDSYRLGVHYFLRS